MTDLDWPDTDSPYDMWFPPEEDDPMKHDNDPLILALDDPTLWCQYASDPFNMNTWPLFHVFLKLKGWEWDPKANKEVLVTWNEAWYTRAPSPEECMEAPRLLAMLQGFTILSSDYAYVPEEPK